MLEELHHIVNVRNVVFPLRFALTDAWPELGTTASEVTSPRHGSLARPGHCRTNLIFVGVRLPRGCEQSVVPIGQDHPPTRKCHDSEQGLGLG